jgi:hypothetical protein
MGKILPGGSPLRGEPPGSILNKKKRPFHHKMKWPLFYQMNKIYFSITKLSMNLVLKLPFLKSSFFINCK